MFRVFMVTALALMLVGCSDGQVQRGNDADQAGYIQGDGVVTTFPPGKRDPAPPFEGPLLDGGDFHLSAAARDVVVLNVWGSWCPPCRKEAPDLEATYQAVARHGVRFVGVNTRDTQTGARAFENEFAITYPSIVDPKGEALLAFRDTLPPAAIPSTLVIDRSGRLAARILGPISKASLSELVLEVAAEDAKLP